MPDRDLTAMPLTFPTRGAMAAVLLSLGVGLGGCDALDPTNLFSEKYKPEVVADTQADKLYSDGLAKMEDRDYEGASKTFDQLDKQYSYSDWSRKALLMTAYSNYEGAKYDDAITASKRYLQRHPASKDAAYAQYLMAMSQYKQIPDATRDQERSERALVALTELVQKYPTSEYTSDARNRIQIARDQLAGREMEVGRYYLQQGQTLAAMNRFRRVVDTYQTTSHTPEALYRMVESGLTVGLIDEATRNGAVLGQNFPGSPWYQDAYSLLTARGFQPAQAPQQATDSVFRRLRNRF